MLGKGGTGLGEWDGLWGMGPPLLSWEVTAELLHRQVAWDSVREEGGAGAWATPRFRGLSGEVLFLSSPHPHRGPPPQGLECCALAKEPGL